MAGRGWDEAQSAQCTVALRSAESRHGTAPGLLAAIAKAESGRPLPPLPGLQPWPWVVNADGAAVYFDGKAAAVIWTRLALARGVQQMDVGCMQVNLQFHPQAFRDLDEAFDPAANTDYAARFLGSLHDEAGDWMTAVGYYHSRTPFLAADYRERVAAIAEGRDAGGAPWGAALCARHPAGQPADFAGGRRGAADQREPAALAARAAAHDRLPDCRRAWPLYGSTGPRPVRHGPWLTRLGCRA